jgi:protein associated with RNAse G/E
MAIIVIKQDPHGNEKIRYQGEVIEHLSDGAVIQAQWTMARRDLGYVVFEPGDRFIEYYYTNRWFNIFDIADAHGRRKGWSCNIAEPAHILEHQIEQVDLLLDVWVSPQGKPLILDEDEFAADTMMTATQRRGAQAGLQALLKMLATRQEAFSSIRTTV